MKNILEKTRLCPYCGSHHLGFHTQSETYSVFCRDCLEEGPAGFTQAQAVKEWNTYQPWRRSFDPEILELRKEYGRINALYLSSFKRVKRKWIPTEPTKAYYTQLKKVEKKLDFLFQTKPRD